MIEQSRERLFVLLLLFGTVVIALGMAFLILGISMNMSPPSPYFESFEDKITVIVGSVVSIILGFGMIRGAMKVGGWR